MGSRPEESGEHDLGPVTGYPQGEPVAVDVGRRRLVVIRDGDRVFALRDVCPHQGAALSLPHAPGGRPLGADRPARRCSARGTAGRSGWTTAKRCSPTRARASVPTPRGSPATASACGLSGDLHGRAGPPSHPRVARKNPPPAPVRPKHSKGTSDRNTESICQRDLAVDTSRLISTGTRRKEMTRSRYRDRISRADPAFGGTGAAANRLGRRHRPRWRGGRPLLAAQRLGCDLRVLPVRFSRRRATSRSGRSRWSPRPPSTCAGKRVLLVDDVARTGATLRAAAGTLAGAAAIHTLVVAGNADYALFQVDPASPGRGRPRRCTNCALNGGRYSPSSPMLKRHGAPHHAALGAWRELGHAAPDSGRPAGRGHLDDQAGGFDAAQHLQVGAAHALRHLQQQRPVDDARRRAGCSPACGMTAATRGSPAGTAGR